MPGAGPRALAVDPQNNVWIAGMASGGGVAEFKDDGSEISPAAGFGSNTGPAIAMDSDGTAWVQGPGSTAGASIVEINSSGNVLSPANGYSIPADSSSAAQGTPGGQPSVAVDASGNVWSVGSLAGSNSLMELVGAAAPTRTPLVAAVSEGFTP